MPPSRITCDMVPYVPFRCVWPLPQIAFGVLSLIAALLAGGLPLTPAFSFCAFFGKTVCASWDASGRQYLWLCVEAAFLSLVAAFSAYVPKGEVGLWVSAFALSGIASGFLLHTMDDSTPPEAIAVAALPVLIVFIAGVVLKEVRTAFQPELAALRSAKYHHKTL